MAVCRGKSIILSGFFLEQEWLQINKHSSQKNLKKERSRIQSNNIKAKTQK